MKRFSKKSELEKTIAMGLHGAPELRPEEKRRYLGSFRERVLQAVTFDQLRTREGIKVMTDALKDPRAVELLIHEQARGTAMPLIVEARRRGVDFTIVSNPDFVGNIAAALVAADAVDAAELYAETE
ncbi:MAG: YueI family protein [Firmicutes bacterium]|nr:YueI family protein [Bacillota bacterium]